MQYVEAHGARIPAIGFGTWSLKGDDCYNSVRAAIDVGYNHIDTAVGYGNETEVGKAIKDSGVDRDSIFLTTKIPPENLADGDMQKTAAESLKRLGVDQVDLMLIHWPSLEVSVADSVRSLNDVKNKGMTRHIGVSNHTPTTLAQAWDATEAPIVCNQCEYHPHLNQDKLIGICRERGMGFVAFSPIGRGKVLQDPTVKAIAERLGRTPAQVALRWFLQQPQVITIPQSSNPAHVKANFDVFGFTLSDEDMAAISGLAHREGRLVRNYTLVPEWADELEG